MAQFYGEVERPSDRGLEPHERAIALTSGTPVVYATAIAEPADEDASARAAAAAATTTTTTTSSTSGSAVALSEAPTRSVGDGGGVSGGGARRRASRGVLDIPPQRQSSRGGGSGGGGWITTRRILIFIAAVLAKYAVFATIYIIMLRNDRAGAQRFVNFKLHSLFVAARMIALRPRFLPIGQRLTKHVFSGQINSTPRQPETTMATPRQSTANSTGASPSTNVSSSK